MLFDDISTEHAAGRKWHFGSSFLVRQNGFIVILLGSDFSYCFGDKEAFIVLSGPALPSEWDWTRSLKYLKNLGFGFRMTIARALNLWSSEAFSELWSYCECGVATHRCSTRRGRINLEVFSTFWNPWNQSTKRRFARLTGHRHWCPLESSYAIWVGGLKAVAFFWYHQRNRTFCRRAF